MMRNPLHSICPYFAMFPESFVQKQLLAYSCPGDKIFDPFCGRGTTIFEGLLNDRNTIGSDINPVAACVAGAKSDVPTSSEVRDRINQLEQQFLASHWQVEPEHEFFAVCFSQQTFQQLNFLKTSLQWETGRIDRFIAAMTLGVLHGESHRTELCLSNRMPRTISIKPDYSIRWWKARGLTPPNRDTFSVLRRTAEYRFSGAIPKLKGTVVLSDARSAYTKLSEHKESVSLVITSPPYIDTTEYAEDQWLRLWFLGGPCRPSARLYKDDRHTNRDDYWTFLSEVWRGCSSLLKRESYLVIRIGGTMLDKAELFQGILVSLRTGFEARLVTPLHEGESSTIRKRQTNSFRPGTSNEKLEHDFAFAICA